MVENIGNYTYITSKLFKLSRQPYKILDSIKSSEKGARFDFRKTLKDIQQQSIVHLYNTGKSHILKPIPVVVIGNVFVVVPPETKHQ